MKPLCIFLFRCLILTIAFLQNYALAETRVLVEIATENIELSYLTPPHLDQIIADTFTSASSNNTSQTHFPVYWLGASLTESGQSSLREIKRELLFQLRLLALDKREDLNRVESITSLYRAIENMPLSKRIFISLDYDFLRLEPTQNPIIDGSYKLRLPIKPSNILVLGAVKNPGSYPWKARTSANTYLTQAHKTKDAEQDYAIVIQPDGHIEQHFIAYWNHEHLDIAPGAIILMGFNDKPERLTNLDFQIASLLRNHSL